MTWIRENYHFILVGIPMIIGSIWKIIIPLLKFRKSVGQWISRDSDLKNSMEGFIHQWTPNGGSSGWDRMKRIEEGMILTQSILHTRDRLDEVSRFSCDEDGRIMFANRSFCKKFGITEDVSLGWGWINLFSPNDGVRDDFRRKWVNSIGSETEFFDAVPTNPYYVEGGPVVEVIAYPVRLENDGEIVRWDGIIRTPSDSN